jgi:cell division protein FtsW
VNMGVAVQLFPVTGQTLPLISSGGTSIWVTCLALGIVISVSTKREAKKAYKNEEQHPLEILSEAL